MPPSRPERRSLQRCAIYTRKSVQGGLDKEYTSLDSQRDVCSAFVKTKKHLDWAEIAERYDDPGFSGGNLQRPALERLLADVERGSIDIIVVYKIDRLTRSLPDFIRLMDILEKFEVAFVSVTQSFDTQDSMGRLILNVLLTFAQFEREMIIDRIRDKMAAMKKAGRWTGGPPPFGYDVREGRLEINQTEAEVVRSIFQRYLEIGSYSHLVTALQAEGLRSKAWTNRSGGSVGGRPMSRGMVYGLLQNRIYIGQTVYQGEAYAGLHEPIIEAELWERAQRLLAARRTIQPPSRTGENLLLGFIFDGHGRRMCISSGVTKGRKYRYYVSDQRRALARQGCKRLRAGADDLERLVIAGIATFLRDRSRLSPAAGSLGYYDRTIEDLIANGPSAARRLETLKSVGLRKVLESLVLRVEVGREHITLMLRLHQLGEFLGWDGIGSFRAAKGTRSSNGRIHCLTLPAAAVRSERVFRMPIPDAPAGTRRRNRSLIDLLRQARWASHAVYENRDKTVEEIARQFKRSAPFFHRLLRINYLAPDIQAAIFDGRQPPDLTRKKLASASIPMDWSQQRAMLGFPPEP
jgi:DNA invertase Pin-like site-specific DNA recombinase